MSQDDTFTPGLMARISPSSGQVLVDSAVRIGDYDPERKYPGYYDAGSVFSLDAGLPRRGKGSKPCNVNQCCFRWISEGTESPAYGRDRFRASDQPGRSHEQTSI